jgi:hypothetical protein
MPIQPNDKGQGIIEYLLIIVLVIIVLWIMYKLLGPAIQEWIQGFLNNI